MSGSNRRGRDERGNHAPAVSEASSELQNPYGANLRLAREKAELTQDVVAAVARTGMTTQHDVSEVENGAHNITPGTMASLADPIGAEVQRLLRPPKRRVRCMANAAATRHRARGNAYEPRRWRQVTEGPAQHRAVSPLYIPASYALPLGYVGPAPSNFHPPAPML